MTKHTTHTERPRQRGTETDSTYSHSHRDKRHVCKIIKSDIYDITWQHITVVSKNSDQENAKTADRARAELRM